MCVASMLALASACSHDLGPEPAGSTISGTVTYAGSAHLAFTEPVLVVSVATSLAQPPTPHALQVIADPDFSSAIEYEVRYAPAADYFLVAAILDNADPSAARILGFYPDTCSASGPSITVNGVDGLQDHDITIYDAISDDPCFGPPPVDLTPDPCPNETAATMRVQVDTATSAMDAMGSSLRRRHQPGLASERRAHPIGDRALGRVHAAPAGRAQRRRAGGLLRLRVPRRERGR